MGKLEKDVIIGGRFKEFTKKKKNIIEEIVSGMGVKHIDSFTRFKNGNANLFHPRVIYMVTNHVAWLYYIVTGSRRLIELQEREHLFDSLESLRDQNLKLANRKGRLTQLVKRLEEQALKLSRKITENEKEITENEKRNSSLQKAKY